MLFDMGHVLYMVISTLVIVGLLVLSKVFVKEQERKNKILKIAAIVTVILHYSNLYVEYFSSGSALVENSELLPIYPCHIAMWLLVAIAFWKKREGILYKIVTEFTFYLGVAGGILGILLNIAYESNPNLADWYVLKGLLSHSTMLFGCIYLFIGDYVKIRVNNIKSMGVGLVCMLIHAVLVIGLFEAFHLDPPNAMYLLGVPFEAPKWFNTWTIGCLIFVALFIVTSLYEYFRLPKEERWYIKLKQRNNKNI